MKKDVMVEWVDGSRSVYEVEGWRVDFTTQIELVATEGQVYLINPEAVRMVKVPNLDLVES